MDLGSRDVLGTSLQILTDGRFRELYAKCSRICHGLTREKVVSAYIQLQQNLVLWNNFLLNMLRGFSLSNLACLLEC